MKWDDWKQCIREVLLFLVICNAIFVAVGLGIYGYSFYASYWHKQATDSSQSTGTQNTNPNTGSDRQYPTRGRSEYNSHLDWGRRFEGCRDVLDSHCPYGSRAWGTALTSLFRSKRVSPAGRYKEAPLDGSRLDVSMVDGQRAREGVPPRSCTCQ